MKTIFFLAMTGIVVVSLAGSLGAVEMSVGAKGGAGICVLFGGSFPLINEFPNITDKEKLLNLGFVGGGIFEMKFNPMFGIEADLFYSIKGQKYELSSLSGQLHGGGMYGGNFYMYQNDTLIYTTSYLDIPLLVKYVIPLRSSVNPVIFAGPSFNILLSSKENFIYGEGTLSEGGYRAGGVDTQYSKDFTNAINVGLVIGGNIEWPSGLIFDIRYSFGLTKVANIKGSQFNLIPSDWEYYQIAFLIGYEFKL